MDWLSDIFHKGGPFFVVNTFFLADVIGGLKRADEYGADITPQGDVIEGSWTVAPVSPKKSNEEAQNQLAALMEEYPVDAIMAANGGGAMARFLRCGRARRRSATSPGS